MSLTATDRQGVSALVSLRVPRGEAGDLDSGVVDVLEAVDGVDAVELEGVTGVRPTWTDIHVDADVRLELVPECAEAQAGDDGAVDEAVADLLADGFGVTAVTELTVERPAE